MESVGTRNPTVLSEAQLKAMLTLLGDDDPAVSDLIQEKLLAVGQPAFDLLKKNRAHPDPAIRRRICTILNQEDAQRFDSEFLAFILSNGEHLDLEQGVWRFILTTYPEAHIGAFQAQLDEWASEVQAEVGPAPGPGVAVDGLNEVLFQRKGFIGNSDDYFNPANSYLNRVMDLRRGIPISLSVLYMLVGRRLGFPLVGIGMPGHFICRYQTAAEEIFIDPFHQGRLLSRLDCRKRLQELALDHDDRHFAPLSHRRILQRMIANLHLIHKERRQHAEAERLQRYLVALSR